MKKFYEDAEKRTAEILKAPRKKAALESPILFPNLLACWPLAVLSGIFLVTGIVLCVHRYSLAARADDDLPMLGVITLAPFAMSLDLARMAAPLLFLATKFSKSTAATISIVAAGFEIAVDLLCVGFAGFPHAADAIDQYGLWVAAMFMVDILLSAAGFGWAIHVRASEGRRRKVKDVRTRARDLNIQLLDALLCFDHDSTLRTWETISNFRTTLAALEEDFVREEVGAEETDAFL